MIGETAKKTLTKQQLIALILIIIGFGGLLAFDLLIYFVISIGVTILVYLSILFFKSIIVVAPYRDDGFVKVDCELLKIKNQKLPTVTVLAPLYHEEKVVKNLVNSLLKQKYPADKLETMLLLEKADQKTIEAVNTFNLPKNFKIIICDSNPKTKPAALNVGLAAATGEFLVIYDAEDRPQKNQILAAVTAFSKSPADVACIQAKISFWNKDRNFLTKFFTAEYAAHFEIFLPALSKFDLCVPLGGTSNFFRTKILKKIGGWDPFNVTEDADLGVRIARVGFKVKMLESITWEEANSNIINWLRQRSRWIKGYLQTYLVHMRHPAKLYKDLGFSKFVSFQLIFGAGPVSILVNPFFWSVTGAYIATRSSLIEAVFPAPIFYLGLICTLGNFVFVFLKMSACLKAGQYNKVVLMVFAPFYWVLTSFGAFYGLLQLITKPHHWEKTQHGLEIERPIFWWTR
jgi:cellulose synthase/poly-beta-1,6-N-acetylglucosamine synthase-like glycosyltransferase